VKQRDIAEGTRRHPRDLHYEIRKKDEMEFVYAAFFETPTGRVLMKFGRSCVPAKRIRDIAMQCPYAIQQACFAQAGSKAIATAIEYSIFRRLKVFHTRGEWYEMDEEEIKLFGVTVFEVFGRVTGRKLKWTHMDMTAMLAEVAESLRKFNPVRYMIAAKALAVKSGAVDEKEEKE